MSICACAVLLSVLAVSVPARSSSGNVISPYPLKAFLVSQRKGKGPSGRRKGAFLMDKHPRCRTVFQLANKQQTADYRRLFDSNITVKGMNPAFVGPYLFEAVEENHMYKVPHMHTHEQIRARHRRIEADLEREEQLHEKYAPLQKY